MRLSSRRIRLPKTPVPPQIDITKLSPSQYTPRVGISGLTRALRAPTPRVSPTVSPTASAKSFFATLQTGTSAEIKQALDVASPETLAKKDRAGNNAYHYLARNAQLNAEALDELLDEYADEIEYTANKKGETPLSIALEQSQDFGRIHVFLREETDFNRVIHKNETIVHCLFKNEILPVEDFARITTQLLTTDINKDRLVSALPMLTRNLINRYKMLSPARVGTSVPGVSTKNKLALKLFNDFVLIVGREERNKPTIESTLDMLLSEANASKEDASKIAFIKELAKPIFDKIYPVLETEGKTRIKYGTIMYGGRRKNQGASRAPRASRTKSTK
jgi:hypothetical protein